jgi:hypothetical protein
MYIALHPAIDGVGCESPTQGNTNMALGLQGNIRHIILPPLPGFSVNPSAVPFGALDHGQWDFRHRYNPTVSSLPPFLEEVGEPSLATTLMVVPEALCLIDEV